MNHPGIAGIERAALELHQLGANVIPLLRFDQRGSDPPGTDFNKRPAFKWARWKMRPQSAEDVIRMFHAHEGNIAALGGIHSDAIPDAGHLAYIDCDSARSFDMIGALIRSVYGETLTAKSARGGHYWIRTDEPIRTHPFGGGELRGRGAYVVAPPSIHPSGIEYRWIDADAPILRINELPGLTFETCPCERLPRLAARILANDERVIGRYATRSEVDWALMLSLVNSGYSFERIVILFESSQHESHLDCKSRDWLKRLQAEYLRARELADTEKFTAAREIAESVQAWALSAYDITGNKRTRETDRRVLLAHVDVAHRTGRLEWHMSQRDIEIAAQVSLPTACKATKRLQTARIIKRAQSHRPSYATKWQFGARVFQLTHSHTPAKPVCVSVKVYAHAAFEHAGLGRFIARTFSAIVDTPLTEDELAQVTGFEQRTIDKHLSCLAAFQLVAIRDGRRWQALPDNLDDAAYALRTADIATKRRKRIERERVTHRRRLSQGQSKGGQVRR